MTRECSRCGVPGYTFHGFGIGQLGDSDSPLQSVASIENEIGNITLVYPTWVSFEREGKDDTESTS